VCNVNNRNKGEEQKCEGEEKKKVKRGMEEM
jgi:hypothetical protein